MTIKQQGGIFGRNPTFNDVEIEGTLTTSGGLNQSGDLTVDTNTLYVNSSSNEVCVGQLTAINAGKFNVKTDSAHNGISVTPYADNYYTYYGTNAAGSQTFYVRGDGISNFQGAMTVEGQINNTGSHVISSGNLVIATSGNGIDFSATSGTGTSELFDDYEEGTWTPTFEGSTSGSLVFGSVLQATYFKIGKLVYVNCYLASGNLAGNTVSGNCLIKGLPYTGDPYSSAVTVTQCNLFTFDEEDISISGYCEGSNVRLVRGSRGTNITDSDVGTSGTAGTIMFQMTYGAL